MFLPADSPTHAHTTQHNTTHAHPAQDVHLTLLDRVALKDVHKLLHDYDPAAALQLSDQSAEGGAVTGTGNGVEMEEEGGTKTAAGGKGADPRTLTFVLNGSAANSSNKVTR